MSHASAMGFARGAAALAALLVAGSASALHGAPDGDASASKHISFGGFLEFPDSARDVDGGMGANYGYGRSLGPTRAWELRLFGGTRETGVEGATDFYHYGVGGDLFQYFGDTTRGHPYALAGLGAILSDVDPDDQDGASGYANLALGWRAAPIKGWGLRPRYELRATYDTFEDGQVDLLLGATLEIPAERERMVEKLVEVERVVEVPAAAPADLDGDGVPDVSDQCPGTVAGAKVEPDGCVRKAQVVVLPNIEFAYEKADLTAAGREVLETVVRFMNDQPEITLDVWGHTDWKGAELYNLRLSERRAAAVMKFLVEQGIAESRLKSVGFGESRPLASNETDEGRERNRRVELNIRAPREGSRP
jgi:OOP family OmpA-OmpF porin